MQFQKAIHYNILLNVNPRVKAQPATPQYESSNPFSHTIKVDHSLVLPNTALTLLFEWILQANQQAI
jgi:hypothetical protein